MYSTHIHGCYSTILHRRFHVIFISFYACVASCFFLVLRHTMDYKLLTRYRNLVGFFHGLPKFSYTHLYESCADFPLLLCLPIKLILYVREIAVLQRINNNKLTLTNWINYTMWNTIVFFLFLTLKVWRFVEDFYSKILFFSILSRMRLHVLWPFVGAFGC